MPELPEVETVVRDIRPLILGKKILSTFAGKKKLRSGLIGSWLRTLKGELFSGVRRRGKWIIMELGTGKCLLIHLGMTGQLTVVNNNEPVESHTHLRIELSDLKTELRFRDIRRFGSLNLFNNKENLEKHFFKMRLGPEPWDVSLKWFHEKISGSNRPVKNLLLDQQVLSGPGNIYADEALFASGLNPNRKGKSLTKEESKKLLKEVKRVLTKAIARKGSTLRDYVGGTGLIGGFQSEFRVYGREGNNCVKCGTKIIRMVLSGRSSHFCPKCQPKAGSPG